MDGPVCRRPGGVSVCFQDECGGRPCLRSIPLFFFAGGGGGGGVADDAYPVVVESDTVEVSVLQSVESDKARVSVLPVAGCEFPAVFWGRSPLMCLAWALARHVS